MAIAVKKKKDKSTFSEDENILSIYLKEINRIPLLTRAEEDYHARLAAKNDRHSKEVLIRANLRFVVNVAKKYQNQGLPLVDIISEGNIGLMNAIERFDVTRGYHFISYAVWWIRQAILKAICEKSRMIRLPLNRANELVQIEKARKSLQTENGMDPEIKEIADILEMDKSHVADLVNISRDLISLESPVNQDKDASLVGDFVENEHYIAPDEVIIEQSLRDDINTILATLSEKEAEILQYRFGLNGKRPMSLKEIGDKYRLTKERIRQIEKKAIKRLQHPTRSQLLKSYVMN
jgi:RNA polymerase primary sigma factor